MNVDETDAKIAAWLDRLPVGRPATPHEAARLAEGEAWLMAMRDRATWSPARPVVRLMAVGPVATPCPRYARPGDAGMDLPVAVDAPDGVMVLPVGDRVLLGTGWAFAIPAGYEGQVRPRSSANVRGIHVPLGTIDSGYRGEVRVVVENRTGAPLTLRSGDRVAQLVIAPVAHAAVELVDALDATERGAGGFGSTG